MYDGLKSLNQDRILFLYNNVILRRVNWDQFQLTPTTEKQADEKPICSVIFQQSSLPARWGPQFGSNNIPYLVVAKHPTML